MERLEQDLRFIRDKLRWPVLFHDPNMGRHLDDVLDVMERIGWRTSWAFEADLNALTEKKLQRLSKVNCRGVGIGIESWTAYGHKTGTAAKTPAEKYAAVCQRLAVVRKYIPGIAANMIWPSDTDQGPQPLDLTAGLMEDCPFLWTPINTPVAFGGTPMYAKLKREGRVLPLPLVFQTAGYLNIVPKHYGPAETLRGFIDLVEGASQWGRWRRRTRASPGGSSWATSFTSREQASGPGGSWPAWPSIPATCCGSTRASTRGFPSGIGRSRRGCSAAWRGSSRGPS